MQKFRKIFFLALIFILPSCNDKKVSVDLLNSAQNLIESSPAEALKCLESIHHPELLDMEDYMRYTVIRVQAKYQVKQDISNDTLIFEAEKYYEIRNPDLYILPLAHFYAGNTHFERKEYDEALKSYFKAALAVEKTEGNLILKGKIENNIGYLYYSQDLINDGLRYYLKALNYFEKAENSDHLKLHMCNAIGTAHYANKEMDSAFVYYNKGLVISKQIKKDESIALFTKQCGMVHMEKGEYTIAKRLLNSSLNHMANPEDSLRVFLNLGRLYNLTHKPDSASIYLNIIKKKLDNIRYEYTRESILKELIEYNLQCENYKEAANYNAKLEEVRVKIESSINKAKLLDIEKKYRIELEKKEIHRLEMRSYLYILIIILLLITIVFIIIYYHQKRNKERAESLLVEAYEEITTVRIQVTETQGLLSQTIIELKEAKKVIVRLNNNELIETQDKMKLKVYDLLFYYNIFRITHSRWKNTQRKIQNLTRELGVREKPELLIEIESLFKNIEDATTDYLTLHLKDLFHHMPVDNQILSRLRNDEIIVFIGCYYRLPKIDIAKSIDISEDELDDLIQGLIGCLKHFKVPKKQLKKIFNEVA